MNSEQNYLWEGIKKGDPEVFKVLYNEHVDFLYSYGCQFSKNEKYVRDCIHDVFLDIYTYRENISEIRNIRYYLLASFKRKLLSNKKKTLKIVRREEDFDFISEENSIEESIIIDEQKDRQALRLAEALSSLTESQRKCLYMRFTQGKTYEEIAIDLDISLESARTKQYRAIKSLRKALRK